MKAVVAYLCSDGEVHVFDAARRDVSLCGMDVLVIGEASKATHDLACEACAYEVLDAVEAENYGR